MLLAGGRSAVLGGVGAEIAASATSLQWTTGLSPGAEDDVAVPIVNAATRLSVAAKPTRMFMRFLLVDRSQRGSRESASRESWKPQLFAASSLASSALERMPSFRYTRVSAVSTECSVK